MTEEYYDPGDGVEVACDTNAEIPAVLPKPYKWSVLLMPAQSKPMSRGGLALPQEVLDNQEQLQLTGRVVAFGPLAFKSHKLCADLWDRIRVLFGFRVAGAPKIGQWVLYGRYTGLRFEYAKTRLIMLNDDELLADPVDPHNIRVYV